MEENNNGRDFKQMRCHVFEDYNVIFDEKNSSCGTVRRVQWVTGDNEPDISKSKLEIRKIYNGPDGEKNGKGYTFSTEEGPGELVLGLIDAGFGTTGDIILHVKGRDDFVDAVQAISFDNSSVEDEDGEIYDMRDLLLKELDEEEEEA
jgi:hypothetical protein